jgi:hypothetical protein
MAGFFFPQCPYIEFGRSTAADLRRVCLRRPKTERATLVAFHRPSSRKKKEKKRNIPTLWCGVPSSPAFRLLPFAVSKPLPNRNQFCLAFFPLFFIFARCLFFLPFGHNRTPLQNRKKFLTSAKQHLLMEEKKIDTHEI